MVNGNGAREYTQSGAYAIARYLETTKKLNFWDSLKDWFLHTRARVRKGFIRKKILDNCSSLLKRSDQYWVSQRDAVSIFGTNIQTLRRMEEFAKNSQFAILLGQHYENFDDGEIYYSLEGIYRLSLAFKTNLTSKNRKDESKDVGEEIKPQVDDIVKRIAVREKQITKTKEAAKKRDHKTCQVTNEKPDQYKPFDLAAHHLYSINAYPHLADSIENLITISAEVHNRFHLDFMGGNQKSCTIDDFMKFVQLYYPDSSQVVIWLQNQKLKLGIQEPISIKKSHVLYLPLSRVS